MVPFACNQIFSFEVFTKMFKLLEKLQSFHAGILVTLLELLLVLSQANARQERALEDKPDVLSVN